MWQVIFSTYHKNRIGILRAVPWSFMVSRVITGVTQIIFPYFVYRYFMHGNLNNEFSKYVNGADYITYIVLGSALNVLAVATLMNIGRALITELREGTLEMLLLSPAPRSEYFLSTRALITILLAILSFFCMGILLSSVMLYTRDTYLTQNTLFVTMSLVCGITYPIQYLPDWVQNVAQIFPLTPAVTLFRNVVIGQKNLISNHLLIVQILVLSGIYLVLGMIWYQSMERKLVESIFG